MGSRTVTGEDVDACGAASLRPSRRMSGRRQLALEAIRRHYCAYGCAPTLREIGEAIGMDARHVGAILRDLARAGAIGFRPGVARSITLPDPLAAASTSQLLLALQARGLLVRVGVGAAPVTDLTVAYAPSSGDLPG